jgi:hypothetical protein
VVNYLAADFMMQGGKVGLLSYEMDPADLLVLLTSQLANAVDFHEKFHCRILERFSKSMLMIDEMTDQPHSAIAKIKACLDALCAATPGD